MASERSLNSSETLPGLTARNNQSNIDLHKNGRPKRCIVCEGDNGPAAKKCRTCGEGIIKKVTDEDDIRISKMGKTNPTKQFSMLKHRAKILNCHHGWDIVVIACHKHGKGTSYITFGSPGIGQDFIGDKENRSPAGKAVLDVFYTFASERKASQEGTPSSANPPYASADPPSLSADPPSLSADPPSPLTNSLSAEIPPEPFGPPFTATLPHSPSTNAPSVSAEHISPSICPPSASTSPCFVSNCPPCPSTNFPSSSADPSSASTSSPSTPTTGPPSTSANPPSVSTAHIFPASSMSQPSSVRSHEQEQPARLPSDAVVLLDNGKVVGVGRSTNLTSVHGVPMPHNHHCIVLSWAQGNHPAPYPMGRKDLEENLFLHKNMFYAIPRTMLRRFVNKDEKYVILPFS